MHYSRVPSYYWKDRLLKLRYAGLNAVQTYVPWNFHEPFPGVYNFEGDHDLVGFLKTAQDVGLLVILRAGPYICGEWEMGGLPSWLLRGERVPILRSSDYGYLSLVNTWMKKLLPLVKPLLYENGGPVITVQVENEYGSYYVCDTKYMESLAAIFVQNLGTTVVLFTTDGAGNDEYLECGTVLSLYATVDFGPTSNPEALFAYQRKCEPKGPLVNSEFYTGWLDHWGEPHQRRDGKQIADSLDKILALNASVNLYMFEGGTNFAFWNGANSGGSSYQPQPTSYDYDAPLNERGEMTDKFGLIRSVIQKYLPVPSTPPASTDVSIYGDESGNVYYTCYADLFESLQAIGTKQSVSDRPLTFEDMEQDYGFILYTPVNDTLQLSSNEATIVLGELHDRASIYWNRGLVGTLLRSAGKAGNLSLSFNVSSVKGSLAILVENMGRVNYGSYLPDKKGILNGVYLNGDEVKHWTTTSLPLNNTDKLQFKEVTSGARPSSAVFYKASFSINGSPNDTYLQTNEWKKGVAFINNVNLGRYWPAVGPQKTLYVPATALKEGLNDIILFEIDAAPADKASSQFVYKPDLGLSLMQYSEAERRQL